MKTFLYFLFLSFASFLYSQNVEGTVTDEEGNSLAQVLVYNLKTMKYVHTDINGNFRVEASTGDELRMAKKGFERNSKTISEDDFHHSIRLILIRSAEEIEEVQVQKIKLSGEINKDSKMLTKADKAEELRKDLGVPKPPEKPRETPTELKKDVLLPLLSLAPALNIQGIYNVVSGKARRQKNLYRYEDLQDNIRWIRNRVEDDYFTKTGIPQEKISEFIQFAMGKNQDISKYVKAGNLSVVLFALEENVQEYLKRMNEE